MVYFEYKCMHIKLMKRSALWWCFIGWWWRPMYTIFWWLYSVIFGKKLKIEHIPKEGYFTVHLRKHGPIWWFFIGWWWCPFFLFFAWLIADTLAKHLRIE